MSVLKSWRPLGPSAKERSSASATRSRGRDTPSNRLAHMTDAIARFLLAFQSLGLLLTAAMWWRVWQCLCNEALESAAFWTALTVAQAVVVIGVVALRSE